MANKIHKFSDYSRYDSMAEDFINSFDSMIVESDKSDDYKRIEKYKTIIFFINHLFFYNIITDIFNKFINKIITYNIFK